MLVAVIIVYIMAALMAVCGFINLTIFCCDGWDGMDIAVFSEHLAAAALPLAVAAGLVLLAHMALTLKNGLNELASHPKALEKVYGKVHGHRMFGAAAEALARSVEAMGDAPEPEANTVEGHKREPNMQAPHAVAVHSTPSATQDAAPQAPLMTPQDVQPGSIFHINPVAGPEEPTTEKPIGLAPAAPIQVTESALTPPPLPPEIEAKASEQPAAEEKEEETPPPPPPVRPQDPSLNFFRTN